MKQGKYLTILIGISLTLIAVLGIVGCSKSMSEEKNKGDYILSTDQKLVNFSAISSANILSGDSKQLLSGTTTSSSRMLLNGTTQPEPDMDKVNSYMLMMETLFTEEPVLVKEETSDKAEYVVKQTYEFVNLDGTRTTYVLYLNEALSNEEHDEKEYNITGLAIINELEYTIKGQKEIEDNEVELELRIQLDKNNYITIENEQETGENEYSYRVVKDGKLYSHLSFEQEQYEETSLKITTTENGYKETYKFIKENNKIKIEHTTNTTKYTIFVNITQNEIGETIYEYKVKEKDKNYNYKK